MAGAVTSRRAFTLLEILMATALMGFGVLTMIGVYISGMKLVAQGRDLVAATDQGQAMLEAIKAQGFDPIPDTGSYDGRVPTPAAGGFPPAPYPMAQVNNQQFFMVLTTARKDTYLKSVKVDVYWGPTSHITLQTLVAP